MDYNGASFLHYFMVSVPLCLNAAGSSGVARARKPRNLYFVDFALFGRTLRFRLSRVLFISTAAGVPSRRKSRGYIFFELSSSSPKISHLKSPGIPRFYGVVNSLKFPRIFGISKTRNSGGI